MDRLKAQERASDVARFFKLNESTVRTIKLNKEKIRKSVESGTSVLAKITARPRATIIEKLEKALVVWIGHDKRTIIVIKQKSLKLFSHLKQTSQPSTDESNHQFVASIGWFDKFKKRHGLPNVKIQGEKASADTEAAEKYPPELAKIVLDQNVIDQYVIPKLSKIHFLLFRT